MTKVLRIINRFNLGGITYNVSYLSRYLPQEYETMLIGGPEEESEESSLFIPESLGLKPLIIEELRRSINPFKDYFAYRRIKKIIREFKPDIVHTHASKAGAVGRLAAISCRVPVIVHTFHGHVFHGYFSPLKTRFFKFLESKLAARSSAIVAISPIQKNELTQLYHVCDEKKTYVIPLGFDLDRFAQKQEEKRKSFREKYKLGDELVIGIIGRLAPIKNHYLFIDAMEHVLKHTKKNVKAVLVGDGETKAGLTEYLESKNLSYGGEGSGDVKFVFAGWIREVDWALAGIDIVALSSKNEGTPVSLIEAQAAGKFIVSTNVGGIKDILHPDCGLLSERDDAGTFKKNLLHAVENYEALNEKAKAGQKEITEKFSYKRLCRDMDELYKKLLRSRQ
jgi:glycosyltransferase involved in cell wall biosynthesis